VYVIGLSERIANVEVLKRAEYFGRYGKIQKIVVGTPSHIQQGAQQLSYAAYVTYVKWEDALRCIAAINNTAVDGRVLKVMHAQLLALYAHTSAGVARHYQILFGISAKCAVHKRRVYVFTRCCRVDC
jgi:hypothetical protein